MMPAEVVEFCNVDELTWSAVRFRLVPSQLTFESDGLDNELSQSLDGQLLTGTDIDMAVANLTESRNGSATSLRVVAVDFTISLNAVEYAGVLLDTDDVGEVDVEQNVNRSISHVLTPEELTQW